MVTRCVTRPNFLALSKLLSSAPDAWTESSEQPSSYGEIMWVQELTYT